MSQSLLSSLHASSLPVAEIGYPASFLSQAIELGVSVAPTAIIPVSTLKEIAEYNRLGDRIEQYRLHLNYHDQTQQQVARESLAKDIRRQEIPSHVSSHLTSIYHQVLKSDFVTITASFCSQGNYLPIIHQNVKGDANLGESLLAIWAEAVMTASSEHLSLFPAAVVLQAAPQPTVAGTLYTAHPKTGNKTRVYIESAWGVYIPGETQDADSFEVDNRTLSMIFADTGHQRTYWARSLDRMEEKSLPMAKKHMATLTRNQLTQLAGWAMKLKQHTLNHIQLYWQLVHDQLQVTTIEPITLHTPETVGNQEILAVGDSLVGGYVQGTVCVAPTKTTAFTTGHILITESLTKVHQGLIRQAAAIVTEHPITDSLLLQLINHYHIPTIVNAKHATRRVQNLQELIVDASGGKIVRRITQQSSLHTSVTLTSIVNNPYTPLNSEADAYYFKSDFSLLMDQLSPQEIVGTSHSLILKNTLVKHLTAMSSKPLWYRLSAIHQGQLTATTRDIEHEETNPYFGHRGAIAHLHDPAVLFFELGVLKDYLQKSQLKITLVLPFVRTPAEGELLAHLITSRLGETAHQVSLWLEVVTPDSLINLRQYLRERLGGVVVPLDSLHAIWSGLDPENTHLLKEYPMSPTFIEQTLAQIHNVTPSCMIESAHPHVRHLHVLLDQGVKNIAVKATQLTSVKKQLVTLEERSLTHASH